MVPQIDIDLRAFAVGIFRIEVTAVGRFARLPDRGRDMSAPASGSTWPQRLSVRMLWNHTEVSLLSGVDQVYSVVLQRHGQFA